MPVYAAHVRGHGKRCRHIRQSIISSGGQVSKNRKYMCIIEGGEKPVETPPDETDRSRVQTCGTRQTADVCTVLGCNLGAGLPAWSLRDLPVFGWIFSGYTGFLSHSTKNAFAPSED